MQAEQLLPSNRNSGEERVASWKPGERYQTLSYLEPDMSDSQESKQLLLPPGPEKPL